MIIMFWSDHMAPLKTITYRLYPGDDKPLIRDDAVNPIRRTIYTMIMWHTAKHSFTLHWNRIFKLQCKFSFSFSLCQKTKQARVCICFSFSVFISQSKSCGFSCVISISHWLHIYFFQLLFGFGVEYYRFIEIRRTKEKWKKKNKRNETDFFSRLCKSSGTFIDFGMVFSRQNV